MAYTALLDANVLHPIVLCDLLLRFAEKGFYRPLWSREILDETTRSILRRHPDKDPAPIARRVCHMEAAFPDALVTGYEGIAATLDRLGSDAHVMAAAIVAGADAIVTNNVKDFPPDLASKHAMVIQTADDFLVHQWWLDPRAAARVVVEQSAGTRNPHRTVPDLLSVLGKIVPAFSDVARGSKHLAHLNHA